MLESFNQILLTPVNPILYNIVFFIFFIIIIYILYTEIHRAKAKNYNNILDWAYDHKEKAFLYGVCCFLCIILLFITMGGFNSFNNIPITDAINVASNHYYKTNVINNISFNFS